MLDSIPKQYSADTPFMYPFVAMSDVQIQELSWVIAAMITGVVLWATGGWILRPAVGALGLALGGLLGWTVWQETGIGPAWIPPLVGGVVVACVALLAYRLLAGGMLAASLALLAGLGTWTVLSVSQEDMPRPPIVQMLGLADSAAVDGVDPETPTPNTTIAPVALPAAPLPATTDWLDHEELTPFRQVWSTVPPDPRLIIMIAAAAGALTGLVLATFTTTFAAVLLTACCGGLLILAAGPRLLDFAGLSPSWLESSAAGTGLVIAWIGLTIIGLVVQSLARPRLAATPTPPSTSS